MRQFKTSSNTITNRSSMSVADYLRDINNYPLISPEEEVELAQLIRKGGRAGERAKAKLVEANLRFVVSVANQYQGNNMELADLISEGNIGLIKAAELFDETRGFKFISYAVHWIRQSIIQAISNNGNIIRLPQNQQNLLQLYVTLSHETEQTEHRQPTAEEFADFASISVDNARRIICHNRKSRSIDAPISSDDNEHTIADTLQSYSRTDQETDEKSLQYDVATILLKVLPNREVEVITRFYGIGRHEETLDTIANALGLSRERTRQVREQAITRLRNSGSMRTLRSYLG